MDATRRWDASAVVGGVAWVAIAAVADVGIVAAAVLLAVLALVPAAVPLAVTPRRDGTHARPYRWATAAQPVAAALFALSTLLGPGTLSAALALPWLGVALLLAWFGLWRLVPRGLAPAEETLLDAGLVYLPVGAAAAVAWRLDLGLGYGTTIVHLTAAHYHYATFLLPVVAAALGRQLRADGRTDLPARWTAYRLAAAVLVAGVPLVAAGITASPVLEAVAATLFAAAVLVVAALFLETAAAVREDEEGAAALLALAALSVSVSMVLAVAYAVGQWRSPSVVGVQGMIPTHGLLNALGFALPAVLAWRRLDPPTRARPPGIPFDGPTAGWRVGPEYAERNGLAGDPLPGQVDEMARYAGERFDPEELAPAVGRFYERTVEYRLTYRVRWHRPFAWGAGLAAWLTGRVEQLDLPVDGAVHEMVGRCPALDAEDPRGATRFWIRTDPETGEGRFVATYGVHERDGTAYVTIGMPLPGASLAAVLVPSNLGEGLELSSVPRRRTGGRGDDGTGTGARQSDAGLWLVVPRIGPVKLPVHERFRVRPADAEAAPAPPEEGLYDLTATHEMWLLGRRFLTIEYGIAHDPALAFEGG